MDLVGALSSVYLQGLTEIVLCVVLPKEDFVNAALQAFVRVSYYYCYLATYNNFLECMAIGKTS